MFSDSDRESMQAMLTRVTEPVSYQAFQHFITHAPWDADRIWRRFLEILPERRGVLILDGTSLPKQGQHSGRCGPAVLRRAGEDRQLPSRRHGRALDRYPRVAAGRLAVVAAVLDRGCGPASGGQPSEPTRRFKRNGARRSR